VLKIKNIKYKYSFITPVVKYVFVLLITICVSSFNKTKHPFYLGLTEINVKESGDLQVSIRLFSNDLENALERNYGNKIDLLNPKNKHQTDSLLNHYITKKFTINYNQKNIILNYLGYEKEEESIWIYYELIKIKKPKSIVVSNTLLYELFPSQSHIVRLKQASFSESKKITNPIHKAEFIFN
jgi:hypothetical protein